MTTASANARRGFTLVEVLMAILIMTVGLLGLLQSVNVAYQHSARNRLREEAVQLAEEQMNAFRLAPFDRITAGKVVSSITREISGGSRSFLVTRDCLPMETGAEKCRPGQGNSKRLSVSVLWQFQNQTTQHVIYTIKNR